jgi:hypothetical protein
MLHIGQRARHRVVGPFEAVRGRRETAVLWSPAFPFPRGFLLGAVPSEGYRGSQPRLKAGLNPFRRPSSAWRRLFDHVPAAARGLSRTTRFLG